MNPMHSDALAVATLRLVDAEAACEQSRRRLHAEQRATVLGCGDDARLDEAVLAFREARRDLAAARAVWCREYGATSEDAGAPALPALPAARAELPEARLARWLLEPGAVPARALAA